jgi:hypothetical protein
MLEEYFDVKDMKIIIRKYSYLFVIIYILVPCIFISNCSTGYNYLNSLMFLPVILGFSGAISEDCFKAKLLQLATANKSPRKG